MVTRPGISLVETCIASVLLCIALLGTLAGMSWSARTASSAELLERLDAVAVSTVDSLAATSAPAGGWREAAGTRIEWSVHNGGVTRTIDVKVSRRALPRSVQRSLVQVWPLPPALPL